MQSAILWNKLYGLQFRSNLKVQSALYRLRCLRFESKNRRSLHHQEQGPIHPSDRLGRHLLDGRPLRNPWLSNTQ